MFGRKCTLCGEKVDGRGICTGCGLNNNKSVKHYTVNESSCENEPLTHIHRNNESENKAEKPKERALQQDGTYEYTVEKPVKTQQTYHRPSRKKVFSILVAVIAIVGIGVSVLQDSGSGITDRADSNLGAGNGQTKEEVYDPYEMVTEALPKEGEFAEYALLTGNYIVGVHIPEGRYRAETKDGLDAVKVQDYKNIIHLFEYKDSERENHLDDLRLYDGAIITIDAKSAMKLYSKNAQTADMKVLGVNPLTETVQVEPSTTSIAGKDFPAGIYDVYCNNEDGYVEISIVDEDGKQVSGYQLYHDRDGAGRGAFQYMVLPEGAIVECAKEGGAKLVPSEGIASEDYWGFYKQGEH